MIVDMGAVGGVRGEEDRLAHTDHRLWTARRVTALHRAECRQIEDNGDGAEAAVVDGEAGEDVRGHTHVLGAARRGGAFHALLTAGHRPDRLQDEATAGETARHGEAALAVEAVEAGEGEAPAIAPTAVTAAQVGSADEPLSAYTTVSWKWYRYRKLSIHEWRMQGLAAFRMYYYPCHLP